MACSIPFRFLENGTGIFEQGGICGDEATVKSLLVYLFAYLAHNSN